VNASFARWLHRGKVEQRLLSELDDVLPSSRFAGVRFAVRRHGRTLKEIAPFFDQRQERRDSLAAAGGYVSWPRSALFGRAASNGTIQHKEEETEGARKPVQSQNGRIPESFFDSICKVPVCVLHTFDGNQDSRLAIQRPTDIEALGSMRAKSDSSRSNLIETDAKSGGKLASPEALKYMDVSRVGRTKIAVLDGRPHISPLSRMEVLHRFIIRVPEFRTCGAKLVFRGQKPLGH
jgi:hypothetical protein